MIELFSPGLALHNWVDSLQMRWVCHNSQTDVLVGHTVEALLVCAKVVLDIT